MNGENGEPYGLRPDEDGIVPLSLSSVVVASPNGNRARVELDGEPSPGRSARPGAEEFTPERMIRPAPDAATSGWRRAVFSLSRGRIAIGPSREELRRRELLARVKTPVGGCRKIAFISRKGG